MDYVYPDAAALSEAVAADLDAAVAGLQAAGLTVRLALTGGTIANRMYSCLNARPAAGSAHWTTVEYYWGDERFVARTSQDRNERQARDAFLHSAAVPEARLHPMPANDDGMSAPDAAAQYAANVPDSFNIVLLGLGPDAHIASLFPGFEQLDETEQLCVPVRGAPKPPPERLSLTLPALNRADQIWFLVSGSDKADAVASARDTDVSPIRVPAGGVQGRQQTRWYLDQEAAAHL